MTKQELEDQLLAPLKGKKKALILMHENPDPDSIAAAYALKYLFKKMMGSNAVIAYSGIIGRAENLCMVKLLGIEMTPVHKISVRHYPVVAFVDSQPHTGNVFNLKGVKPTIIIDHHPIRKSSLKVEYTDIRKDAGSTSTILTQYFKTLNIQPDKKVATALYYGIMSDTRDLGRQSTDSDMRATIYLYPLVLQKALSKIEHPKLPKEYFVELYSVLKNARIYGDAIIARIDLLGWPEMIGEFADELIQIEGMRWCLCYGRQNGHLLFSIRTTRTVHMAGVLAHKITLGIGSGGGHETFAAGKVDFSQALKKVKDPEETLIKRFLKEVNIKEIEPIKLIKRLDDSSSPTPQAAINIKKGDKELLPVKNN